jgi:hypothetical protein
VRACRCACGGDLVAWGDRLEDLVAPVALHVRTPLHRAWRRRRDTVTATAAWRRELRAEISGLRLSRALELERLGLRL